MKILISVLILLLIDILVFIVTKEITNKYTREQHIISDNLETLITSVETKKINKYRVAVQYPDTIVYEFCNLVLDNSTGLYILVPDSLYSEFKNKDTYSDV